MDHGQPRGLNMKQSDKPNSQLILVLPFLGLGIILWPLLAFIPKSTHVSGLSPVQTWPQIELITYTQGLVQPVHLTHSGDGSGRLFVVERKGRIRIIADGVLTETAFLDITDRVRSSGNEEGLLSVAFPSDYAEKGYFYVYYTNEDGDNLLARYSLKSGFSGQADPDSEDPILLLPHPDHKNHNGGQLAFGPDGYLYIGTGDGGGAGDPDQNAQDLSSLLGKLLRIDVEFAYSPPVSDTHTLFLPLITMSNSNAISTSNYRIPPDNPFVENPDAREEIWALGLRNPWRFSFDRLTGDLYLGDVGQRDYEEIDFQPSSSPGGENYGWSIMEASHCYEADTCDKTGLVLPVAEYTHTLGCSVTGGNVYRGELHPELQGIYIYADYCSGLIWGLKYVDNKWQSQDLLPTDMMISSFGEDEAGEVYVIDYSAGVIYQIEEAP